MTKTENILCDKRKHQNRQFCVYAMQLFAVFSHAIIYYDEYC